MKRIYIILGLCSIFAGILFYQSMLNQINEIDEFIIIELDSGNLIV